MTKQPVENGVGASAEYYEQGFWQAQDLWGSFAECASRNGDRVAFIDGDRTIDFAALRASVARIAAGLTGQGIATGDVVVIHARNSIESVQAMLACACVGAVMTPLPPMFSAAQLKAICASASAKALLALGDAKEVARAVEAVRDVPGVRLLVVADGAVEAGGAIAWSMLAAEEASFVHEPVGADALAMLVYSSGTTGAPKGVMHSANTVRYAIEQRARLHEVEPGDIGLVVAQFGFVGSVVFGLLLGPLTGCTSVLMRTWDGDMAVRLIERHRVTYGLLMPTHVHDLLSSSLLDTADVTSLRRCAMGGLTRERRLEVRRRLCPQPLPAYGMSECLGYTSCAVDGDGDKALLTDGHPYPGTRTRVVDEAGDNLPAGVPGAILVNGPSRFLGYYGASDLTRQVLTGDGWFRTGDIGWLNDDGYIGFVARENDIIRRGGITIVPGDVERVLTTHPRVEHVAIVAVPDDRLGERACACVITRDGAPMPLTEVSTFLEQHQVARYTWPERVVQFTEFPRSASLKVQKRVLVEQIARRDAVVITYPFAALPERGRLLEVAPGVFWIRMPLPYALDHINVWAISDDDGWTMVDTGVHTDETLAVWAELLAHWPDARPIRRVICTHMHPDHVGLAGWLTRKFGARLWMTRLEYLNCRVVLSETGQEAPEDGLAFYRRAGWSQIGLGNYRSRFGGFGRHVHALPQSFRRMQDGDTLRIGGHAWRVVVGTGHSPEHACLHCPSLKVLISGDQVLPRISSNVSAYPMEPDANPMNDWLASLERIRDRVLDDVLVLPSHNEPFRGLHARIDALALAQQRAFDRLRDALKAPRRVVDVFTALFSRDIFETDGPRYGMATGEAMACLNYLVARGEAVAEADGHGVLWFRQAASPTTTGAQ